MKKTDVNDVETLDLYYSKGRKIRFADNIYITSLDDIYNNLYPNKFGDRRNQQPTYWMKGTIQCEIYRSRSIDDFIKLSKKYFPDVTIKNCFEFLYLKELELDEEKLRQQLAFCPNIRKYNFRGITSNKYAMSILDYRLTDLNKAVRVKVSELLT